MMEYDVLLYECLLRMEGLIAALGAHIGNKDGDEQLVKLCSTSLDTVNKATEYLSNPMSHLKQSVR